MYRIHKTIPYRDFRDQVGDATFHINTAYVGMEWIARGFDKPSDLEFSWQRPRDPKQEVDQARGMIHAAMLTRITDALDAYLAGIADEEWLDISDHQRNVLRKSITKPGTVAYSVVDRIQELQIDFGIDGKLCLGLVAALVAWRNQAVHASRATSAEVRVDDGHVKFLCNNATILSSLYGGFNPSMMFGHMQKKALPKRKEIVSLAAAAQNLVREIDWKIIRRTIPHTQALEARAKTLIITGIEKESDKAFNVLWSKNSAARKRKMLDILKQNGFSDSQEAGKLYTSRRLQILRKAGLEVPEIEIFSLPQDFLEHVASLSREHALADLRERD